MKINVKWVNVNTGQEHEDQFPVRAPLQAVKIILLSSVDWADPGDAGQYAVKKEASGPPLDETKSLEELGIADGATLFLAKT